MSRKHLTAKQRAFLTYLQEYVDTHREWPTYKEICAAFGYRSPHSVTQNLRALEKKRFLRRDRDGFHLVQPERQGIPVLGLVSAGPLQEALEAHQGTLTLEMLFPNLDRLFALRVSGQSMIGAGINDGDYVLLIDDDIPDGGIGAVLYDGETSLKRIFKEERGLRLVPANPDYDAIHIKPDLFEEVRILGRYVGHVNETGIVRP